MEGFKMLTTIHKKNDVVTIKLVSGEEIVGYFVSDDSKTIILRKPVVPVPTGQGQIGLAPYLMSSDYLQTGNGEIPFNNQAIITVVTTSGAFTKAFIQQVSGIDLSAAAKSGLITS